MSTTGPQAHVGDTTEPTIDTWRARYQSGARRVQFVGLFGNAAGIYGTIKRVTTANVFVLIDGQEKAEPFHPGGLRPTNVWPKATS